jgi:hypothetical protein
MKRAMRLVVVASLLLALSATPARAHGFGALGGFIAGTFFGAAISQPVFVAPVYAAPRPVLVPAPVVVPGGYYAVRYSDCGRPYRVWVPARHYRYRRW